MDLVPILEELGVSITRVSEKTVQGYCALHAERTGKPDRHPSWSIYQDSGQFICFSCGWRGDLPTLYRDLDREMPPDLDMQLVSSNARAGFERVRQREAASDESRPLEFQYTEEGLLILDPVPDRILRRRHLEASSCERFQVLYDRRNKRLVMPVRMPDGELIGVQYRQAAVNPVTLPEDMPKGETFFGIVQAMQHSFCAVVESPLDAVRFWNIGVPAVASLGASLTTTQVRLLGKHFSWICSAMDDDAAGDQAWRFMSKSLGRQGVPVIKFWYGDVCENYGWKDPGDFDDDEVLRKHWERTLQQRGRRAS